MWHRISNKHSRLFAALKHGMLPVLFYFAAFCLLTIPLMQAFFTAFFGDRVDGLQNVWNLWWVNQAVRYPSLHPSIWYTNLLHWPLGTTLRGHTLNPFNGYLAVPLLAFLSLKTTYNAIFIFSFVAGGVTAYWLAYMLTRSYWPSIIAGFLFTFSSYHLAQASEGHLQLVSLEWIPMFLLCWYSLISRPRVLIALAAAASLWLVVLCDYYYFFYCILAALMLLAWYAILQKSLWFAARREYLVPLGAFCAVALLLIGPLVFPLLIGNSVDPLIGAHDAAAYSMDLFALFVPGMHWLFNGWTQAYWSRLPGSGAENNVYLALPVFALIGYLWIKRRSLDACVRQQVYLWSSMMGFFFLLALGPELHVAGKPVWSGLMPYTLLTRLIPFLGLSGAPSRMAVMVILAASLLSAFALRDLRWSVPRQRLVMLGLLALLLLETLPSPIATTSIDVPAYVTALASLPDDGGVLDLVKTKPSVELYYQTIHHKPIAFGYLARVPASVVAQDEKLSEAIASLDYGRLWNVYRIRYIVSSNPAPVPAAGSLASVSLLYDQKGIRIYRLAGNVK